MFMQFKQLTLSLCILGLSAASWAQTTLVKSILLQYLMLSIYDFLRYYINYEILTQTACQVQTQKNVKEILKEQEQKVHSERQRIKSDVERVLTSSNTTNNDDEWYWDKKEQKRRLRPNPANMYKHTKGFPH